MRSSAGVNAVVALVELVISGHQSRRGLAMVVSSDARSGRVPVRADSEQGLVSYHIINQQQTTPKAKEFAFAHPVLKILSTGAAIK